MKIFLTKVASLRIFPKLVLTFLVVLSPLFVIGLQINMVGSHNVKQEITNSLSSRVDLYMELLDNDFEGILILLQDYLNDEDLMKLSLTAETMSPVEKGQAILRLKKRLDLLQQTSKFVKEASVFIPLIDRTVSSNVNAITNFNKEEFNALIHPAHKQDGSPFLVWNDRTFITLSYPSINTGKQSVFVLAVEVSRPELISTLSRFTNEGGGAALVGKQTNWAVVGTTDAQNIDIFLEQKQGMIKPDIGSIHNVSIKGEPYMVAREDSDLLNMSLLMFVPSKNVNSMLNTHRIWLIILSLVSAIITLAFSYSIYRIIHKPLKSLVYAFRRIEQGQLNQSVQYPFKDEFGYLYEQFNVMSKQLSVLVHEVYEQQYRAQLAELRHLQSQINPHFLYNTYFILYRMAQLEDNENVTRLTKHLGEYFQYITRDGAEEVPLAKEVHHARIYMEIQTIRFAHRIKTHFGVLPEGEADMKVPRLILQPIIENAYNHSLEKKPKDGWLSVEIFISSVELVIAVEDNGEGLSDEKLEELRMILRTHGGMNGESTGMINVHRRLQIKYGERGGLRLTKGEHGGLKVEIVIPTKGEWLR